MRAGEKRFSFSRGTAGDKRFSLTGVQSGPADLPGIRLRFPSSPLPGGPADGHTHGHGGGGGSGHGHEEHTPSVIAVSLPLAPGPRRSGAGPQRRCHNTRQSLLNTPAVEDREPDQDVSTSLASPRSQQIYAPGVLAAASIMRTHQTEHSKTWHKGSRAGTPDQLEETLEHLSTAAPVKEFTEMSVRRMSKAVVDDPRLTTRPPGSDAPDTHRPHHDGRRRSTLKSAGPTDSVVAAMQALTLGSFSSASFGDGDDGEPTSRKGPTTARVLNTTEPSVSPLIASADKKTVGGDASNQARLSAVKNARAIAQLIQEAGDEATRCHERWLRRKPGATRTAAVGGESARAEADARRVAARLRQKRKLDISTRISDHNRASLQKRGSSAQPKYAALFPDAPVERPSLRGGLETLTERGESRLDQSHSDDDIVSGNSDDSKSDSDVGDLAFLRVLTPGGSNRPTLHPQAQQSVFVGLGSGARRSRPSSASSPSAAGNPGGKRPGGVSLVPGGHLMPTPCSSVSSRPSSPSPQKADDKQLVPAPPSFHPRSSSPSPKVDKKQLMSARPIPKPAQTPQNNNLQRPASPKTDNHLVVFAMPARTGSPTPQPPNSSVKSLFHLTRPAAFRPGSPSPLPDRASSPLPGLGGLCPGNPMLALGSFPPGSPLPAFAVEHAGVLPDGAPVEKLPSRRTSQAPGSHGFLAPPGQRGRIRDSFSVIRANSTRSRRDSQESQRSRRFSQDSQRPSFAQRKVELESLSALEPPPACRRRRLPEIPRLRNTFRDQWIILGGRWQSEANTVKRLHYAVAHRLGLAEEDWDTTRVYGIEVSDLEKAAVRKLERERHEAAARLQRKWIGYRMYFWTRALLLVRKSATDRIQRWWLNFCKYILPIRRRVMEKPRKLRAVSRVQAIARGWVTRRKLRTQLELHKVQWHMHQLRQSLRVVEVEATKQLQTAVGGFLARARLAELRHEAELLQARAPPSGTPSYRPPLDTPAIPAPASAIKRRASFQLKRPVLDVRRDSVAWNLDAPAASGLSRLNRRRASELRLAGHSAAAGASSAGIANAAARAPGAAGDSEGGTRRHQPSIIVESNEAEALATIMGQAAALATLFASASSALVPVPTGAELLGCGLGPRAGYVPEPLGPELRNTRRVSDDTARMCGLRRNDAGAAEYDQALNARKATGFVVSEQIPSTLEDGGFLDTDSDDD